MIIAKWLDLYDYMGAKVESIQVPESCNFNEDDTVTYKNRTYSIRARALFELPDKADDVVIEYTVKAFDVNKS
jgi:hypothetical protein